MISALQSFLTLVERDPLYAAEGLDLTHMRDVLASLETECASLQLEFSKFSLMHRLFLIRYPIAQYVFPIAFLRALVDSEEARRAMIQDPSIERAHTLIRKWKETQDAYAVSVARYATMHRLLFRLEGRNESFTFQDMLGNVTEQHKIDEFIQALERNAEALTIDISRAEEVLKGTSAPLESRLAEAIPFKIVEESYLNEDQRFLHGLDEQHGFQFRHGEIIERHGPFVVPIGLEAQCPKTPRVVYAYVIKDTVTGLKSLKIAFGDMFRFLTIAGPNARFGGIGRVTFEGLIRRGIKYFYQPVSNLYVTRDPGYWADIATIVDSIKRPELDQQLLWKHRSSSLDLIVQAASIETRHFAAHNKERREGDAVGSYSAYYGLLMRSYPGIMFTPFNSSVWRLREPARLIGCYRCKPEDMLYVDEHVVLKESTKEQVVAIMRGGRSREEDRDNEIQSA